MHGKLLLTLCLSLIASPAIATVTAFEVLEVDKPHGVLDDFKTTDFTITGTGQLTRIQMLLEITEGEIFQEENFGLVTPPSPALIPIVQSLEFDTFIALGSHFSDYSLDPLILGGTVPSSEYTFNGELLDIVWAPPEDTPVTDPMDYIVARVTLSDDAAGTIMLLGSTLQEPDYFSSTYRIQGGTVLEVPEPSTVLSMFIAGAILAECARSISRGMTEKDK